MSSWAVVHKLRVAGRGSQVLRVPKLILTEAPARVTRGRVVELLEGAGYGPSFAAGGVAWANHSLVPERRWPEAWDAVGGAPVRTVKWSQLEGDEQARRRIMVRLAPPVWASAKMAAARAGVPLQTWCAEVIERAAAG